MSDMFPIKNAFKQGDVLKLLFCKFALQYTIRRVQVKQDGLKIIMVALGGSTTSQSRDVNKHGGG